MKPLSNPIVLRMALVLFACAFSFVMAVMLIRRMRRSIGTESSLPGGPTTLEQLPLHTYHAVIQQLKQQKHELQAKQQAEHRRARTSENVSAAILSNLSSGVLFFNSNGLVRQANQVAKVILGIASPVGMDAKEVFRGASLVAPPAGIASSLAEAVVDAIQLGIPLKQAEAYYLTPGGDPRAIEVTLSGVKSSEGDVIGLACLVNDQSELAGIRRQMQLRGEMSAEMALALRNSLVTISGYAQQLAKNRDPELAQQLAADIAAEASHLDHTIGGFLAGSKKGEAAASGL